MASEIFILDDDPAFLQDLRRELSGSYTAIAAATEEDFWRKFGPRRFELVVLDVRLELAKEGLEVLRKIQKIDPYQPVVVATAYADTETYLEALQAGALLYVDKTRHTASALALLFDAVIQQGRLRREQAVTTRFLKRMEPLDMVGASEEIQHLQEVVESSVLKGNRILIIGGEPGTGRELVARNHHARRLGRSAPPLAMLPRQSMPARDIQRLMTGFASTTGRRRGLLEDAHEGGLVVRFADLLPDEVLEFLVEAVERRMFQTGATTTAHPLDTVLYLICEHPELLVRKFGPALATAIMVPPLRERKTDISLLSSYLLDGQRQRGSEGCNGVDSSALSALTAYDWPGNVAELKASLEYAAILATAEDSESIKVRHLPMPVASAVSGQTECRWNLDYQEARTHVGLVDAAIVELATTNKTKLAGLLRVQAPTTLTRRIERALERYPELGEEFPKVTEVFGKEIVMCRSIQMTAKH